MNKRIDNITPGEILLEEFLKPMGISMYRLAKETGIAQIRVSEIVNNKTVFKSFVTKTICCISIHNIRF